MFIKMVFVIKSKKKTLRSVFSITLRHNFMENKFLNMTIINHIKQQKVQQKLWKRRRGRQYAIWYFYLE